MIIVYGTRCYGKADVIEGLGHVTCRFVHIGFVPLVPIETLFLVDDDRGMKIPFSFKAALSGWLRAGAIFAGILFLLGGFAEFGEGEPLFGAMSIVCGVLAIASFWVWGFILGKCSPQRKAELMGMMGLSPADLGPAHAGLYAQPNAGVYPQPGAYPAPAYPQPQVGGYGAPGYGAPPAPPQPAMGGYGAPPPPAGGFGAPSPYGASHPGGYGGPQPAGYGAPQPGGYGGPQPQGYGGPQPQGHGGPQPQGYGPPGWDPNRR